jgi:hypothetical protein
MRGQSVRFHIRAVSSVIKRKCIFTYIRVRAVEAINIKRCHFRADKYFSRIKIVVKSFYQNRRKMLQVQQCVKIREMKMYHVDVNLCCDFSVPLSLSLFLYLEGLFNKTFFLPVCFQPIPSSFYHHLRHREDYACWC